MKWVVREAAATTREANLQGCFGEEPSLCDVWNICCSVAEMLNKKLRMCKAGVTEVFCLRFLWVCRLLCMRGNVSRKVAEPEPGPELHSEGIRVQDKGRLKWCGLGSRSSSQMVEVLGSNVL
ncbi:hypothetical protein Droror1_Dr00008412 [Drosera rotundifolia]